MYSTNNHFMSGSKPVQLHGVNWFGFNNGQTMFDGHWNHDPMASDFATTVARMRNLGFNAVRLPFSFKDLRNLKPKSFTFNTGKLPSEAELAASITPPGQKCATWRPLPKPPTRNGTECNGYLPSTTTFDRFVWVVQFLTRNGFFVLIDNHLREDKTVLEDKAKWVREWTELVRAICKDSTAAAMLMCDLLNEPDEEKFLWDRQNGRAPALGPLYLEAMDAIEKVAPAFYVVEGCGQGSLQANWGDGFCTDLPTISRLGLSDPAKFFAAIPTKPYKLRVALSPHVYGPFVTHNENASSGAALSNRLSLSFGSKTKERVYGKLYPVAIGEFGSKFTDERDKRTMTDLSAYLRNVGAGNDGKHAPIGSWFYWCWNNNSGDTNGLVQGDWKTLEWNKLAYLRELGL